MRIADGEQIARNMIAATAEAVAAGMPVDTATERYAALLWQLWTDCDNGHSEAAVQRSAAILAATKRDEQ